MYRRSSTKLPTETKRRRSLHLHKGKMHLTDFFPYPFLQNLALFKESKKNVVICLNEVYKVNSEFVNDLESTRLFVKKWTTQLKKISFFP